MHAEVLFDSLVIACILLTIEDSEDINASGRPSIYDSSSFDTDSTICVWMFYITNTTCETIR